MIELEYDAFISYRHCELDKFVAANLQKKLERFRLPNSAMEMVGNGDGRIHRVFRDVEELPLTENLSEPIDKALENSKFLIVICTPRISQSPWCLREMEMFLKTHDRKNVLMVLAEGEPYESFPDILTHEDIKHVAADGTVTYERRDIEPLAADARGANKKEILKALDLAVIKIAAAIFNLNYDDIKQRHREQRLRRRLAWCLFACSVFMVFAITCLVFLARISAQKDQLEENHAGSMALVAERFLGRGNSSYALYAVRSVMNDSGYVNSESYRIMNEIISPYSIGIRYSNDIFLDAGAQIKDFTVSADGKFAALVDDERNLKIYEVSNEFGPSPLPINSFKISGPNDILPQYAFSNSGTLIYSDMSSVNMYDINSKKILEINLEPGCVIVPHNIDDYTSVVVSGSTIYGIKGNKKVYSASLADRGIEIPPECDCLSGFSEDGKYLALVVSDIEGKNYIVQLNAETGEIEMALQINIKGVMSTITDGKHLFVLYSPQSIMDKYQQNGRLYVFDMANGNSIGYRELPLRSPVNLDLMNGKILITGKDGALMVDANTLKFDSHLESAGDVLPAIKFLNRAYIPDYDGHLYIISDQYQYGIDNSLTLFNSIPEYNVLKVLAVKDRLFYLYDKTYYLSVYDHNEFAFENMKLNCDNNNLVGCDAKSGTGLEYLNIEIPGFKIERKEYDRKMTERESERLQFLLVRNLISSARSIAYVQDANIYIMEFPRFSLILDKNLEPIAKTGFVDAFIDYRLIIKDGVKRYSIPYQSYKEIISKADQMLKGFEPKEWVYKRYGITKTEK